MLATDLKGTDWTYDSQYIHVWDSTDLRTFTGYRRLKLHAMATHSWAPEAFWDAGRGPVRGHLLGRQRQRPQRDHGELHHATSSPPRPRRSSSTPATTSSTATWPWASTASTTSTSRRHETLVGARSTTLNPGSFTEFTAGVAHGGTEAPTLVKSLTSGTWYLWGDTYTPNGVFYAWQTTDLAAGTWTALDQKTYTQPLNSKHCGIATITTTEYNNLSARGAPRPGTG